GDDQGGSYYPQALLDSRTVDAVRVDLTCMGGISGGPEGVSRCMGAGVEISPHLFGHVHAPVFAALGIESPIEGGFPGDLVDPFEGSLEPPTVSDGRMQPFLPAPGFGAIVNRAWLSAIWADDPSNIIDSIDL